jgi:hypothetical protein
VAAASAAEQQQQIRRRKDKLKLELAPDEKHQNWHS